MNLKDIAITSIIIIILIAAVIYCFDAIPKGNGFTTGEGVNSSGKLECSWFNIGCEHYNCVQDAIAKNKQWESEGSSMRAVC